jgi:hypothetical protein
LCIDCRNDPATCVLLIQPFELGWRQAHRVPVGCDVNSGDDKSRLFRSADRTGELAGAAMHRVDAWRSRSRQFDGFVLAAWAPAEASEHEQQATRRRREGEAGNADFLDRCRRCVDVAECCGTDLARLL